MRKNVGGIDRTIRLVIGPLLILGGIAGYTGYILLAIGPLPQSLTSVIVFLVGLILTVTAIIQKCPLNKLFGFDTYKSESM